MVLLNELNSWSLPQNGLYTKSCLQTINSKFCPTIIQSYIFPFRKHTSFCNYLLINKLSATRHRRGARGGICVPPGLCQD